MSSEGGRWPKKLYIFLPLFARKDPDDGERVGGSGAVSGIATPNPDMTDTVLARLSFLRPLARDGVKRLSFEPNLGP